MVATHRLRVHVFVQTIASIEQLSNVFVRYQDAGRAHHGAATMPARAQFARDALPDGTEPKSPTGTL
jgi:hypothetical protein